MRFVIDRNQVNCIRPEENDAIVATFDAHLREVAPHVAALLSYSERNQLEQWLADRDQILDFDKEQAALHALPELIEEACKYLENEPEIPKDLFSKLNAAITHLAGILALKSQSLSSDLGNQAQEIEPSEELKVKIDVIKKEL